MAITGRICEFCGRRSSTPCETEAQSKGCKANKNNWRAALLTLFFSLLTMVGLSQNMIQDTVHEFRPSVYIDLGLEQAVEVPMVALTPESYRRLEFIIDLIESCVETGMLKFEKYQATKTDIDHVPQYTVVLGQGPFVWMDYTFVVHGYEATYIAKNKPLTLLTFRLLSKLCN